MEKVKETFTLTLAPWQIRMTHDFLHTAEKKVSKVIVIPGVIHCPGSYLVPEKGLSVRDWVLYLTDEQMVTVKEQFKLRTPIHGINITEDLLKNKSITFV
jgi:hypothetical protein